MSMRGGHYRVSKIALGTGGGATDEGQIKGRTLRLGRLIVFAWIFRRSGSVQLRSAVCGNVTGAKPRARRVGAVSEERIGIGPMQW